MEIEGKRGRLRELLPISTNRVSSLRGFASTWFLLSTRKNEKTGEELASDRENGNEISESFSSLSLSISPVDGSRIDRINR